MNRNRALRFWGGWLLLFLAAGFLSSSFACKTSAATGQKLPELTIRNSTKEIVTYQIAPVADDGQKVEKKIAPGVIHRFRGRLDQDVYFISAGRTLSYRLNAGRPYAFRYDENRRLDLYQASHGWSDVADLAPYVPTPMPVVERMLALAQVNKNSVVYDLGCGDGRIVIAAAKTYGARGVGVDLDAELIQTARVKAKIEGVEKLVTFTMADATKTDIRPATVVTLYLLPESNALLRGKLEQELRPGSIVVSHNYSMPGWEAKEIKHETVATGDGQEHEVYVYRR